MAVINLIVPLDATNIRVHECYLIYDDGDLQRRAKRYEYLKAVNKIRAVEKNAYYQFVNIEVSIEQWFIWYEQRKGNYPKKEIEFKDEWPEIEIQDFYKSPTRSKKKNLSKQRAKIGQICACCGSRENITHDHWIPKSKGGAGKLDNKVWLCQSCNCIKADKIFATIEMLREYVNERKRMMELS